MWQAIASVLTAAKDVLGIEIPELPIDVGSVDVGSVGDSATSAVQSVSQSAVGVVDGLVATATDVVSGAGAGVTQTVSGISEIAQSGIPAG